MGLRRIPLAVRVLQKPLLFNGQKRFMRPTIGPRSSCTAAARRVIRNWPHRARTPRYGTSSWNHGSFGGVAKRSNGRSRSRRRITRFTEFDCTATHLQSGMPGLSSRTL